ncbi:LamG domain-containing protein, partial [Nostoc linckia]
GDFAIGGRRLDGDSYAGIRGGTLATNTPLVHVGSMDYAATAARQWVNGTAQGENLTFQTSGNSSDTDATAVHIGSNGSSDFLTGAIGELVVTKRPLTTGERQKLEGYLAHRWGLAGNLPAGHPHKASRPTV